MKFRAYNASLEKFAKLAGAAPTQVDVPDIPQAFATSWVEAMITSPSTGANSKAWDYVSYYYHIQARGPKNIVVVNKKAFDGLLAKVKEIVLKQAALAEKRGWEMSEAEIKAKIKVMSDNGMKLLIPKAELIRGLLDIGKMSMQELSKRSYPQGLTIGPFVSIFVAYVMLGSTINKKYMPVATEHLSMSLWDKIKTSKNLLPVLLLIVSIMEAITVCIAFPTDAAAVGVVCALIICWVNGSLTKKMFIDSLMGAMVTSCMIAFILMGIFFFAVAMGYAGIPRVLAEWITSMNMSTYTLLVVLTVFCIIIGCFPDGSSVVVLKTLVIMLMVEAQNIDALWFGIYLVIVVEMSQNTPPVGFNLLVIQGLTSKNLFSIADSTFPFFLLLLLSVIIITAFPSIVTFLPNLRVG